MPFQDQMLDMIQWVQSFANPFLDGFFLLFTVLGEDPFLVLLIALVFWCIDKDLGYKMGFAYLSGGIVNTVVKEICRVPRPIGYPGIRSLRRRTAGGYSFPSGHTQQTVTIWYSLMREYRKRWIYISGWTMIVLVGLSRVYLGVHTPLDVIGGILIALAWICVANGLFDWSKQKGKPILLAVFVIPMLGGLHFFPTATYYKAAGTTVGFWLGYLIESRYIHYSVRAAFPRQVARMAVGLAGLLAIQILVRMLLPKALSFDLLRYAMVGLWMTAAAPWLFLKIFPGDSASS